MNKEYLNKMGNTVILSVSNECDTNCDHCMLNHEQKTDEPLAKEKFYQIIDGIAELGKQRDTPFHILFSGGEPTKNPDLPDLVEYAAKNGLTPAISTTAGFFAKGPYHPTKDKQTAEEYLEVLIEKGLAGFCVSLDGSTQEISIAAGRGKKGDTRAYDGTLKIVEYSRKREPNLTFEVETVVQRANYNDIPNIIKLAKGARQHRITNLMLRGGAKGKDKRKVSDDEFRALEAQYNHPNRHFSLKRGPNRMLFISQSGKVFQETGGDEQKYIGNVLEDENGNVLENGTRFEKIIDTHAKNYKESHRS